MWSCFSHVSECWRMSALKKVYAEILLNMAKESAARVLASENKSVCFQQSLLSTKEEAVKTLVRLKSIMDAKVKEAADVSSSQLRRIQDLESQLAEADNTIQSLKKELEKLNDDFRKVKERPMEESVVVNSVNFATKCEAPGQDNGMLVPDSLPSSSGSDGGYDTISESQLYSGSLQQSCLQQNCHDNFHISPSIIKEESDLSRNGCNQQIRVSEQNSSTSGQDNKSSILPSIGCKNDLKQDMCSVKYGNEKTCCKDPAGPNEVSAKIIRCENSQPVRFSNRLSSKDCKSKYASHRDAAYDDREFSKATTRGNQQKIQCSYSSTLVKCDNEEKMDSTFKSVDGNAQRNHENMQDISDRKPVFEKTHVSPGNSVPSTNETSGTSPCAIGSRVVKYTFQRKRLKRCSSVDKSNLPENKGSNPKRKRLDMEICCEETENPSPVNKSPQENHRIAQVARQLISMSEKRW